MLAFLMVAISVATITSTLSICALVLAFKAWTEVRAMQKSTHKIEYVPVDQNIDEMNENYIKEQEIYNKQYSEDLEETMPMFHKEDEDLQLKGL